MELKVIASDTSMMLCELNMIFFRFQGSGASLALFYLKALLI